MQTVSTIRVSPRTIGKFFVQSMPEYGLVLVEPRFNDVCITWFFFYSLLFTTLITMLHAFHYFSTMRSIIIRRVIEIGSNLCILQPLCDPQSAALQRFRTLIGDKCTVAIVSFFIPILTYVRMNMKESGLHHVTTITIRPKTLKSRKMNDSEGSISASGESKLELCFYIICLFASHYLPNVTYLLYFDLLKETGYYVSMFTRSGQLPFFQLDNRTTAMCLLFLQHWMQECLGREGHSITLVNQCLHFTTLFLMFSAHLVCFFLSCSWTQLTQVTGAPVLSVFCNVGGSAIAAISRGSLWFGIEPNKAFADRVSNYVSHILSNEAEKCKYFKASLKGIYYLCFFHYLL